METSSLAIIPEIMPVLEASPAIPAVEKAAETRRRV
jgi:hypothetical protein